MACISHWLFTVIFLRDRCLSTFLGSLHLVEVLLAVRLGAKLGRFRKIVQLLHRLAVGCRAARRRRWILITLLLLRHLSLLAVSDCHIAVSWNLLRGSWTCFEWRFCFLDFLFVFGDRLQVVCFLTVGLLEHGVWRYD